MYTPKKAYFYGTGRRKSSVARVHLFEGGNGTITINGRDIDEYFGLETLKMVVRQPLEATGTVGKVDISAKVWRHTGEKWSRQSEELPLHRVLDLAILACRAQLYFQEEAYRFPRGYDPEHPQVARIGLQGDAMTVEVCTSSDHIDEDLRLFQDALARDGELLGERMRVLARLLGELGCRG